MTPLLITIIAMVILGAAMVSVLVYFDQEEARAAGTAPLAVSMMGNLIEVSESFRQVRGNYPLSLEDLETEFDLKNEVGLEAEYHISNGIACIAFPYRKDMNDMLQIAKRSFAGSEVMDSCGDIDFQDKRVFAFSMDGQTDLIATEFVDPNPPGNGADETGGPGEGNIDPTPTPTPTSEPWEKYSDPGEGRCIGLTSEWEAMGNAEPLPRNLVEGQRYYSENGQYYVIWQTDGNVVTYTRTKGIGTDRKSVSSVEIVDGLLSVYGDAGQVLATWGKSEPGARMVMSNDGYLRTLHGPCYDVLFSTGSRHRFADHDVGIRKAGYSIAPNTLPQGKTVYSPSEEYRIDNQRNDGHVVLYRGSSARFATGQYNKSAQNWRFVLDADGFKQYDDNDVIRYSSNRSGRAWGISDGGQIVFLAPQNHDGNITYAPSGLRGYESIFSPNGMYQLSFNPTFGHNDNRLAVYTNGGGSRKWENGTATGSHGNNMSLSVEGGSLVQKDNNGNVIWSRGSGGSSFGLTNEGKLQLYAANGSVVWSAF